VVFEWLLLLTHILFFPFLNFSYPDLVPFPLIFLSSPSLVSGTERCNDWMGPRSSRETVDFTRRTGTKQEYQPRRNKGREIAKKYISHMNPWARRPQAWDKLGHPGHSRRTGLVESNHPPAVTHFRSFVKGFIPESKDKPNLGGCKNNSGRTLNRKGPTAT